MGQKMTFDYSILNGQDSNQYEIDPLHINVYTSKNCSFCEETLAIVHSAIDKIFCLGKSVEVIEMTIDDNPELVEEMDILALPVVQIGSLRLVGLPCIEDVELLIHETIVRGL